MSRDTTTLRLAGDRCRCVACGELFNSVHAFDAHRFGRFGLDRRCLTPLEMRGRGMSTNDAGYWITARRPTASLPAAAGDFRSQSATT